MTHGQSDRIELKCAPGFDAANLTRDAASSVTT